MTKQSPHNGREPSARHRLLHRPLAVPGMHERRIARDLPHQARVGKEHDERGHRRLHQEAIARDAPESPAPLPRPRLGEREHHTRAARTELDAVRFERKRAADSQLEAQVRLTIYLRRGT